MVKNLFWNNDDPFSALTCEKFKDKKGTELDGGVFLHGICGFFALALHDLFHYPIFAAVEADVDGLKWEDRLVHFYCMDSSKTSYIDVRGVLKKELSDEDRELHDVFFDEFSDFLYEEGDSFFEISSEELILFLSETVDTEEFGELYAMASKFIFERMDDYRVN